MGVVLCRPHHSSRKVPSTQGAQLRPSKNSSNTDIEESPPYLPPAPREKRLLANGLLKRVPFRGKRPPPREMETINNETQDSCVAAIFALFPDICPEFLAKTGVDLGYRQDDIIDFILNLGESGKSYAKKPRGTNKLKRKRADSEDADEVAKARGKYDSELHRQRPKSPIYRELAKKVLAQEFPRVHVRNVQRQLVQHAYCLLPAYIALNQLVWDWQNGKQDDVIGMKKTSTVAEAQYRPENLAETLKNTSCEERRLLLEELQAARLVCTANTAKRDAEKNKEREEHENFERAKEAGAVTECGCCFGDFALNRMIHCDGFPEHWFCVECARRNAETAIGLSKYELSCMSMDGCSGGFGVGQRSIFLDDNLTAALDRIEYEAVLRLAGIENLDACPFCPYAAECRPVTEDKEFRCANPECQVVSCRLCRDETHIPKTCEEAARDHGISARRQIEEAMSAALIRKCNKCGTPFIKENGCNKMMCTRQGCRNVQCYVCSKSCDYAHFDDATRGGKKGNCPLFDSVEQRHDMEVREAEEQARKKVVEENPEITAELLQFKMSEKVAEDDQKRKTNDPYQHRAAELRRLENIRNGLIQRLEQPGAPVPLGAEIVANVADLVERQRLIDQNLQNFQQQREAEHGQRMQRRLGLVMNRLQRMPPRADRAWYEMARLPDQAQIDDLDQAGAMAARRAIRMARGGRRRAPAPQEPPGLQPQLEGKPEERADAEDPEARNPWRVVREGKMLAARANAQDDGQDADAMHRPMQLPQPPNPEPQVDNGGWLDRINVLWAGVPPFAMPFYGGGVQDAENQVVGGMQAQPDPAMVPYQLGFEQQHHLGQMGMNYMHPDIPYHYHFQGMPMALHAQQGMGMGAVHAGMQAAQAGINAATAAAALQQNPGVHHGNLQDVD